jgi:hypothetical protein
MIYCLLYDRHLTGCLTVVYSFLPSRQSSAQAHGRVQKQETKPALLNNWGKTALFNHSSHKSCRLLLLKTSLHIFKKIHYCYRKSVITCSCRKHPSSENSSITKLTMYLQQMIFYRGKCSDCNRYCSNSTICPLNILDLAKEVNITKFYLL